MIEGQRPRAERCAQTLAGIRIARLLDRQPQLDNLEIAKRCGTYPAYVERMRFWQAAAMDAVARCRKGKRKEATRDTAHPLTRLARAV